MAVSGRILGACFLAVVAVAAFRTANADDPKPAAEAAAAPAAKTEEAKPAAATTGSATPVAGPEAGKPGEGPRRGPPGTPPGVAMPPGAPGGPPGKPEGDKKGDASKPEKPAPVQRPTTPPKPPDPAELKVRPDKQGKVSFNFKNQPWADVLEWLADVSGMSLDWQQLPGDYLNLTTPRPYTVRETRDLINRHLLARGFTLLTHGETLSVVNCRELNPALVPRIEADELEEHDPHEFVKISLDL
jgi:hypothetical protein